VGADVGGQLLSSDDPFLLSSPPTKAGSRWNVSVSSSRLVTRIKESYSLERALVANYRLVLKENLREGVRDGLGTSGGWMIFLKPVSRIQTVRTRKMMSYTRIG